MITRVGMAPRRADLTPAESLAHWRTAHADAAARIPGLRRYVQLHPVLVDGAFPLPYPGFDAGSLLDFDDVDAMRAGFASPVYQSLVRADEGDFIDRSGFHLVLTRREVRRRLDEPVVLATFWRRHPAAGPADLANGLEELLAPAVAAEGRGHERLVPLGFDDGGRLRDACEAIDLVGFADADEALDWTLRGTGAMLDRDLAGCVFGAARLVSRPHRVV